MITIIIRIMYVLLAVSLFIAVFNLLLISRETHLKELISKNLGILSQRYVKRMMKIRYKQYYISSSHRKNYIQNVDISIEKANIRRFIPYLTTETLLAFCIIVATPAFIYSYRFFYNAGAAILIAGFFYSLPMIAMNILGYRNASKVDKQLVYFINTLKNFCLIQDDIVFALNRSIEYVNEPFKTFNTIFINEINHGISPFDALENYKNKIDNGKFKLLVKNFQLCAKYKGSYVEVLAKSNEQLLKYSIEQARRKSEVKKGRFAIYSMMIVSAVLFYGIVMMNPYLLIALRSDTVGQLIVIYNVAAILFAIYKSFTLEKFTY